MESKCRTGVTINMSIKIWKTVNSKESVTFLEFIFRRGIYGKTDIHQLLHLWSSAGTSAEVCAFTSVSVRVWRRQMKEKESVSHFSTKRSDPAAPERHAGIQRLAGVWRLLPFIPSLAMPPNSSFRHWSRRVTVHYCLKSMWCLRAYRYVSVWMAAVRIQDAG